jgi:Na+-transporting methylmalonyl-CoA/oxaloacetate decarboxylase gamma subunit
VPAIYIVAVLLVLLFLVGAYRMMGAGASTDEDPRAVLTAVIDTAAAAADALRAAVDAAHHDEVHALRRTFDGCAQALERIAATPLDAHLDEARAALEQAVDELTWSARLAEAPAHGRDPAIRDAALALRTSGAGNLARARAAIAP